MTRATVRRSPTTHSVGLVPALNQPFPSLSDFCKSLFQLWGDFRSFLSSCSPFCSTLPLCVSHQFVHRFHQRFWRQFFSSSRISLCFKYSDLLDGNTSSFRLTLTEMRDGRSTWSKCISLFPALLNFNREAGKGNKVASIKWFGRTFWEGKKRIGWRRTWLLHAEFKISFQWRNSLSLLLFLAFLCCKTAAACVIRVASRGKNEKDKKEESFEEKRGQHRLSLSL